MSSAAKTNAVDLAPSQRAAPVRVRAESQYRVIIWSCTALTAVLVSIRPDKSLWQDEAYTWSTASLPSTVFFRHLVTDEIGGATHLTFQHFWIQLGTSAWWMRLPSMLAAIALVPMVAVLARELFGRRTAMLAAALTVMNATVLAYAQEVRGYAWAMLLAVVSTFCFVRDIDEPNRASRVGWIVSSAALVFTTPFGALVGVGQVLSLVARPAGTARWRRIVRGGVWILAADAVVGALVVTQPDMSILGGPYWWQLRLAAEGLAGSGAASLLLYGLAAAGGVWLGIQAWRTRGRSADAWRWTLLVALVAVPPALQFVASYATPIVIERYLITCLPPLVILVAAALARIPYPLLRGAAVASFLVVGLVGVINWHQGSGREDWRSVATYLDAESRPGDAIVFAYDDVRIPIEYYERAGGELSRQVSPMVPPEAWGAFTTRHARLTIPSETQLRDAFTAHQQVWVVVAHIDSVDAFAGTIGNAGSGLGAVEMRRFPGDLRVYRFIAN